MKYHRQQALKVKAVEGENLSDPSVDPVEVAIGSVVFQKPTPFPKSIYENIAWGARYIVSKAYG